MRPEGWENPHCGAGPKGEPEVKVDIRCAEALAFEAGADAYEKALLESNENKTITSMGCTVYGNKPGKWVWIGVDDSRREVKGTEANNEHTG